jgi:hypothetical protein
VQVFLALICVTGVPDFDLYAGFHGLDLCAVVPNLDLYAGVSALVLLVGFGVPDCVQAFLTLTCLQKFLP